MIYITLYKIYVYIMTKTKKNIKKINNYIDFYGYINNDWIHSHQKQIKKKPYITNFEILNDKIDNNMKHLITNKLIKDKNINNLFNSYIHSNDEVITNYIFLLINEVRDIFNLDYNEGINKLIAWGHERNIHQLLYIRIDENDKDCSNIVYIFKNQVLLH